MTNGPAALNLDLSRRVIEWSGATATGGTAEWFDYGPFTALDGSVWHTGDGVPADSLGVDNDMYLNVTAGSGRGDVYQKVSGTWGSPIVNLSQTASNAILTGDGFSGDGATGNELNLVLNGSTLTLDASGLRWSETLETKLAKYPTPEAANDQEFLQVNSSGDIDLVTIADATSTTPGFMPAADKAKLDKYTDPTISEEGFANKVDSAGVMELSVADKTFVGLDYIPNQFDNTIGYTTGDFVFFEGVNYRALVDIAAPVSPAVIANPDTDSTNWRSLGGGHIIVDGTSGTDVELAAQPNLRFLGNALVADNSGNSSTDVTITGEAPADFNLFADGNLDFADAADYPVTGDGTFAISSANVLRGSKSANWTGVTVASTVTSPFITIPLGYRGRLVEFSLIYRSTDEITLDLLDGSGVISSQVLEPFTETNGSRRIRVFQKLADDQSTIRFRFSASTVGTFTFDDVVITDNFNSTGQLTNFKSQHFVEIAGQGTSPTAGSTNTRIIRWPDVTETKEGSGEDLVTITNTAAAGTSWTANQRCRVRGVYGCSFAGNAEYFGWTVNAPGLSDNIQSGNNHAATKGIQQSRADGGNGQQSVAVDTILQPGDTLRAHLGNNNIGNQDRWFLDLQFEEVETQDVTVYNAQTSAANSFSARITIVGTDRVLSESAPFIDSISIGNSSSQIQFVRINFVPGFFTEIPVAGLLVEGPDGAASVIGIRDNISTSMVEFQISAGTGNNQEDSQVRNFAMTISRQGGDVRSQTANFVIPKINASINEFSARFDGSAAGPDSARVKSQSSPFVHSIVEDPGDGRFVITWVPGVFSVIPSVVAGLEVAINSDKIINVFDVSTTGCSVSVESTSDQLPSVGDFNLTVQKQGADYVAPEVIDVPTQAITTVRGIDTVVTATVDATAGSGSDPGRILTQSVDWIQSIAQTGTAGEFLVTFTPGFFTATPQITGNAIDRSTALGITILTNVNMTCNVNAGVGNINFYLVATKINLDNEPLEEVTVQTPLIRPNEPFLFQRKDLGTAISGTTVDITNLTFNNLEIGKVYRIGGNMFTEQTSGQDGNLSFHSAASGGGTRLGQVGISANSTTGGNFSRSINILFVATSTVMVSRINVANGGTLTTATFVTLEELPYYESTTKWT